MMMLLSEFEQLFICYLTTWLFQWNKEKKLLIFSFLRVDFKLCSFEKNIDYKNGSDIWVQGNMNDISSVAFD